MSKLPVTLCVDAHEQFIMDGLLPLITGYANDQGHDSLMVVLSSFWALSTVLQAEGVSRDSLIIGVDNSKLTAEQTAIRPDLVTEPIPRRDILEESHFEKLDYLTMANSALIAMEDAHLELSHSEGHPDHVYNSCVEMTNATNALRVLIPRVTGMSPEVLEAFVSKRTKPVQEVLH